MFAIGTLELLSRRRRRAIRRFCGRCIAAMVIVMIAVGIAHVALVDRAASMVARLDGERVTLLGRVTQVRSGEGDRASFTLTDLSGDVVVVTTQGPPRDGTIALVRGRKGTFGTGRCCLETASFVESGFRLAGF